MCGAQENKVTWWRYGLTTSAGWIYKGNESKFIIIRLRENSRFEHTPIS
jgi:hypothetical protein